MSDTKIFKQSLKRDPVCYKDQKDLGIYIFAAALALGSNLW